MAKFQLIKANYAILNSTKLTYRMTIDKPSDVWSRHSAFGQATNTDDVAFVIASFPLMTANNR